MAAKWQEVRHTRNAKAAVQAAREALGLTFPCAEEFEREAERLINTTMTDEQFHHLVAVSSGLRTWCAYRSPV